MLSSQNSSKTDYISHTQVSLHIFRLSGRKQEKLAAVSPNALVFETLYWIMRITSYATTDPGELTLTPLSGQSLNMHNQLPYNHRWHVHEDKAVHAHGRASPMRKTIHVWKFFWAAQFVSVTVQLRVEPNTQVHMLSVTVYSFGSPTIQSTCCILCLVTRVKATTSSEPAGTNSLSHLVLPPFLWLQLYKHNETPGLEL